MGRVDPRNAATALPSMRPEDERQMRPPAPPPAPEPAQELPSLGGYSAAPAAPVRPDWLPPPPGPAPEPDAHQQSAPPPQLVDPPSPAAASSTPPPPVYTPPAAVDIVPPQPAFDEDFVESVLAEEDQRQKLAKRFYRRPRFWFLFSTLLMLPGLFLPWIHLNSGPSLDAFHLPLVMLVVGQKIGITHVTAGALMVLLLGVNVFLSLRSDRIASYFRLTALVAALLTLGAFLFGMRSWNLNKMDSATYEKYEDRQMEILIQAFGDDSVIARQDLGYVQPSPTGFLDFMRLMMASGALFPLLSAFALLITTYAFASSQRFISLQIPTTALAVGIVAGVFVGVLAVLNLFFPAHWYQVTASTYRTLGMRGRQETALRKCTALPVPPLSCEMRLGRFYMDTRRHDEAMQHYLDVSRRYPAEPGPHKYIGMIYFRSRDYTQAAEHFSRFREKIKTDKEVNQMLCTALRRLGDEAHGNKDLNTAIGKYEEAYKLLLKNKKDVGFNIRIAELHRERSARGDLKAAAEYLKRAANLDRESLKIQMDAAKALEDARDYKEAVTYYRRCTDVQKDALACYYGIAMIQYVVDKNPSAALETINEGLAVLDVGGPADTLKDLRRKIQSEQ